MSSFKLKILLIGPEEHIREKKEKRSSNRIGKNTIIKKFFKRIDPESHKLTVGVDLLYKDVMFRENEVVLLSIWDISNQQRFEFIRSTFYKGAAGVILIFDLTNKQTYYEVRKWLTEIRQYAGESIPFALIGTNAHLLEDIGEVIDRREARLFTEKEGGIYSEISPKTIAIIDDVLKELTRKIIDSRL